MEPATSEDDLPEADPVAPSGAEAPPDACFEFVYADANIGASSGGHTALKIEGTIYHYQMYADGIFRLVREDWALFRRLYNDLENRSLKLLPVSLEAPDCRRLRDEFALRYLVQLRHLGILGALRAERQLLADLQNPSANTDRSLHLTVPAYGLFAADGRDGARSSRTAEDPAGIALRAHVVARFGPEWVARRRQAVQNDLAETLRQLAIARETRPPAQPEQNLSFEPTRLPVVPELLSQVYREGLQELAALRVLTEARPLDPAATFDPAELSDDPTPLTNSERSALDRWAADLGREVLDLLAAPGPDTGEALLIAQARYRAVAASLRAGRLITLDPFPAGRVRILAPTIRAQHVVLTHLARQARQNYVQIRRQVFVLRGPLTERRYNRLESAAGRYYEIRRGLDDPKRSIRAAPDPLIPGPGRPAPFDGLTRESLPAAWRDRPERLSGALSFAAARESAYLETLRRNYDYDLIQKNCVTELLRAMRAGGALPADFEPGQDLTLIPYRAFDRLQSLTPGPRKRVRTLPSTRKRRLAAILKHEGPRAQARESSVYNSTIYRPRAAIDTAFVLFTDDVFWCRPLFGLINLVYATAYGGVGLVLAPLDDAQRLKAGYRGAVFSVPELFFFNIRKGSYDYVE
jgi:hypothetical protein